MIDLHTVLTSLDLESARAAIEPGWAESQAAMPVDVPFLQEAFLREGAAWMSLPAEIAEAAVRAAGRIRTSEPLRALAWHAHWRMFQGGKGIGDWPLPTQALGADAGMLYALALLGNWPQARQAYEQRGTPPDVVRDTMADVALHLERYRRQHGALGLEAMYAGNWLRNHLRGRIFRLGRLQYIAAGFSQAVFVWRRERDGRTTALAATGLAFRSDGQRQGAGGLIDENGAWTSAYAEDDSSVTGHPLDPVRAVAGREAVRLDKREWRLVLRPGDPVLDMHIPAIGPMTPPNCAESVRRAMEFFPKHFPENPTPRAIMCTTWMLDPQLAGYLGPQSNIMDFQRQFYLYPVEGDPWSGIRHVFEIEIPYGWSGPLDLDALPQTSSLTRGLIAHVRSGGRWLKAGGFVLAEDLPWGKDSYRN